MYRRISKGYKKYESLLEDVVKNFNTKGRNFGNQDRNSLKIFEMPEGLINVKSFKIPNLINQIAYRFFRKSKAQRSFEYANILKQKGIGTPEPIAYYEFTTLVAFKKSYYISKQFDADITFRELTTDFTIPNHEAILRAFTRFTFQLHEKGINFLDHSPGNTLIKIEGDNYQFLLVDLNRMRFGDMDFQARMKNMSRLTKQDAIVKIISDEYATLIGENYSVVYEALWSHINAFQNRFRRKKELKKKLLFWR